MARTFRRQRSAHPIADLNVTNLIDLGFTLLIIFMIATPLINQEQSTPVNLPTVSKIKQQKQENDSFQAIIITSRGEFVWGSQPVSIAELRSKLNAVASQTKPPVIRIRADGAVAYQKVATLMNEIQKQGLSKVTFDAQTD